MRPNVSSCAFVGGSRQRGAVLLLTLVALVVMLVAGAAWARMFNSSLLPKSNFALKWDMENQSERGVEQALAAFRAGGLLSTALARGSDQPANNYSATILASDPQGVPNALALSKSAFATSYGAVDLQSEDTGMKLRYVIDRLCTTTGDEANLNMAMCVRTAHLASSSIGGSDPKELDHAEPCPACTTTSGTGDIVYRVSIKVVGPHRTQSLFQSTFTVSTPSSPNQPTPNPAAEPSDRATARSAGPQRLSWRELQSVD